MPCNIRTETQGYADSRIDDSLSTFGGIGRFWCSGIRPEKCKRHRRRRPTIKRMKRERVLDIVRERINSSEIDGTQNLTVEGVASQLRLEPAKVHWAFMVLNREGILSQGENYTPHDSPRSGLGNDSRWHATSYRVLKYEKKVPVRQDIVVLGPDAPAKHILGGACFVWDENKPPKKKRYSKRIQRRLA